MTAIFVTATGTNIGKTYLTAGLVGALRAKGKAACALKPVISGFDLAAVETSDSGVLLHAMGQAVTPQSIARISPWRFRAALSPDMAAARENRAIDFAELITFCRGAITVTDDVLFIEGVGGVMVTLTAQHTVLDWIAALEIPVLLVAGTYLGTISHTLTALDVLKSRAIAVRAIVLNESANSTVPTGETIKTIVRFALGIPVVTFPRVDDFAMPDAVLEKLCGYVE